MRKNPRKVISICILVFAISSIYGWYNTKKLSDVEIKALFKPVTSQYGIEIEYIIDENFLSPIELGHRPGPGKSSKITPIDHKVLAQYPQIMIKALNKYTIQVINNYLGAVHFAGDIEENGFHYGGSYDPFRHIVYLVNNGQQTEDTAIATFHHEFSSLLLRSRGFLNNPWKAQAPSNFKYLRERYNSWEELQSEIDITRKPNRDDYENGFVSIYGQTNIGNDFSEYSAMIFTQPKKFKQIMNQYPRVRRKFLIWLDFYHAIDPAFTEDYFFRKRA